MKQLLAILLLLAASLGLHAEKVRVRLYSANTISQMNISFDLGAYNLYGISASQGDDLQLIEALVGEGRSVAVYVEGGKVRVSVDATDYGTYDKVRLEATDTACILCLNPSRCKQRTYEGDLEVSVQGRNNLLLVGDVEFETYIAGVVQSEIYGNHPDIFRIQAIISRTWALRNLGKHQADGYNFCDGVHCQAYLNRCVRPDIMLGAIQSSGETLVDSSGVLIETPFHSNSGGQTANSEDVWRNAVPYLRAVEDTFSYAMRQSDWVKSFRRERWLGYFAKTHKVDTADDAMRDSLLSFAQPCRKVRLLGIPLTRIRVDLQLRSTFFSVDVDSTSGDVVLHGHGYGHGVGLSQEGAIRMVNLGIAYDSVLRHYYTGAVLHHDPMATMGNREQYITQIEQIIEEDRHKQTQVRAKKDDWLGRLFRLRDREEREEVYNEAEQDNEKDWQYEW